MLALKPRNTNPLFSRVCFRSIKYPAYQNRPEELLKNVHGTMSLWKCKTCYKEYS